MSLRPSSWLCTSDLRKVSSLLGINEIPVLLLNPLNEDNVLEVISHHRIDVDAFIQQARELGMDAVLGNPLLLDLLVTSVKLGQWPDISSNLLEIACHELIQDGLQEYHDTDLMHQLQSDDSILTLAGKLCAFMLITNKSGWSSTATDNSEILSIRDIEGDQDLSIQEALNSRIFQGASHFTIPAHRLVAEFLGAYYLSRKIENGASVRRVLALLMEHDGILLPDLRGLAAWLATLNQQARSILIQTDPVTIAFNADTKGFSHEEYRELLAKLEEHSPRITDCIFAGTLDGLCGNERVSIIQDLSTMPGRTQNRQALVYLLLRGFSKTCNSTKESDLEKDHKCLLNIIRDHRWQSNVRIEALNALSRILHDTPQRGLRLRKIVYQLRRQKIVDEKDKLQTTLLYILYPDEILPIEIWDFLVDGRFKYPDGRTSTQGFFGKIVDQSRDNQIPELLDSLCKHASRVTPKLQDIGLEDIVLQLLEGFGSLWR